MSNSKFRIPDYEENLPNLKYTFGDDVSFTPFSINVTPTFAYDYISLDQSSFCFNNPKMMGRDFCGYFFAVKEISSQKVSSLFDGSKNHFHIINLTEKGFLIRMIKKQLGIKKYVDSNQLPIVAQFEVETDSERESPRVIFFLGRFGTFHILFYDREHSTYQMRKE